MARSEGTDRDWPIEPALAVLAGGRGYQYVSSEFLPLAALEVGGALADARKAGGATQESLEEAIETVRGAESVSDDNAEENRQARLRSLRHRNG